ncbi:MAG: hypothetical protein Q7R76_06770 [Candidatus Woesearchaeota archaeon]|nr:hypothetical protein [Candidatus Woesearchaeota archaeon]
MAQKTALRIGAVIFGIIAFLHILRLVYQWDIIVGTWSVPRSLSMIAVAGAIGMSSWYWKLSK